MGKFQYERMLNQADNYVTVVDEDLTPYVILQKILYSFLLVKTSRKSGGVYW